MATPLRVAARERRKINFDDERRRWPPAVAAIDGAVILTPLILPQQPAAKQGFRRISKYYGLDAITAARITVNGESGLSINEAKR